MKFKVFVLKIIIYILLFGLKAMSHQMSLRIGRMLGGFLFKQMKSRAQVALDNLKLIYGTEKSEDERYTIAINNFRHLGGAFFELLYVVAVPKRLERILSVEGEAHLKKALQKNKGVVIFSGHLGNFYFLAAALNRIYDVRFLYRRPTQDWAAALYDWLLARMGLVGIADNPRHLCAYHSYSQLKKKAGLGILIDQVETGGLYIDFMGQPAGSTLGAGNMSLKSGAPLVPAYCYRQPDNRLKVVIEPEFEIPASGSHEEKLAAIVAGTNQVVEKWVRQVPEQWFWGHRRWRKWRK